MKDFLKAMAHTAFSYFIIGGCVYVAYDEMRDLYDYFRS